jgi:hypothetical protein
MSKYYYLVAGLPHLTFDGFKPPVALLDFKEALAKHLTKTDTRLFELLQQKIDTKNLLTQLQNFDYEPVDGGKITVDEIRALIQGVQTEFRCRREVSTFNQEAEAYNQELNALEESEKYEFKDGVYGKKPKRKLKKFPKPFKNKNKRLPAYFEKFTRLYLTAVENGEEITVPWEDRLSSMYYEYAMKCSNSFLSAWFELNLNINNIFTALTCRKYKLDREIYIVGNTDISNKLRTSTARDFELGESLAYATAVSRIADDPDIRQREWRTDQLKWEWLDDKIFPQVFDIENVITYRLKLEMQDYWSSLDKAEGEKAFRQIVAPLKQSGTHVLEEFKRNNKK